MAMVTILFLVDTTNSNGVISKDHGSTLAAGTEIEFEKLNPNLKRLIDIGAAVEKKAAAKKDETPAEKPLEEMTIGQLTAKAKELEIEIPKDVTKREDILAHIQGELERRKNDASTDPDGKGNFTPGDDETTL